MQAVLALPRTGVLLLGVTAVIAGMLAAHVWMGRLRASSHHVSDQGTGTAI